MPKIVFKGTAIADTKRVNLIAEAASSSKTDCIYRPIPPLKALIKMIRDFQDWRKVRMIGSAALASVYIASGKADLYMEKKSYLWDIAAGAAIVNAAGGEALILNQNKKFQVDVRFSNSLINR